MRRIGPPWGIFGQESLQIPPAERSPGSTLGLGPLLDIQTFGGRRRRQFEPRYARVEPPPAPTASGPISNIGPRPRADPRTCNIFAPFFLHREPCDQSPIWCRWQEPHKAATISLESSRGKAVHALAWCFKKCGLLLGSPCLCQTQNHRGRLCGPCGWF